MKIMSINAGSSSLKFSLFNMDDNSLITSGYVEIQNLKIFYGPSTSNYIASTDKK